MAPVKEYPYTISKMSLFIDLSRNAPPASAIRTLPRYSLMQGKLPPFRIEAIAGRILTLRGQRVMLDTDLAALYGISTGRFNEAVRRHLARFPADFMFEVKNQELVALRSRIAISNTGRGGRRYAPFAFTEHGAIMAATILNSPRATEVSVYVVRAFLRLRETLAAHTELTSRCAAPAASGTPCAHRDFPAGPETIRAAARSASGWRAGRTD